MKRSAISENYPCLHLLDGSDRCALVIRHAQRYGSDIAREDDGLTPGGEADAIELGRKLRSFAPLRFYSSPVERCVNTARLVAKGAGSRAGIVTSHMLGKPGTFIVDEEGVNKSLSSFGLNEFAERWFQGELPSSLILPIHAGSERFVSWVMGELKKRRNGLLVFICHDLFIAPVLVHYLDYKMPERGLLDNLDGFVLKSHGGDTTLAFRDKRLMIANSGRHVEFKDDLSFSAAR